MNKKKKNWLKSILPYFISGLITLFLIEIGFRVYFYANDEKSLGQLEKYAQIPQAGKNAGLGDLIRISDNPDIIYEFKPNIAALFKRKEIKINADGFRGKQVTKDNRKKKKRILGLGDSVMFGWGVGEGENFMEKLEELLNQKDSSCQWECVNTAVPGYTTTMEVATLEEKGLAYEPDLVIINFIANDLQLPAFIAEQTDYYSLQTSFAYDFFKVRKLPFETVARTPKDILIENRPFARRVPDKYQYHQGIEAFLGAVQKLKELSLQHDFEVVAIGHWQLSKFNKKIQEGIIFPYIIPDDDWEAYALGKRINQDAWQLNETDRHPSRVGHQYLAEQLFEHITANIGESPCPSY